MARERDTATPAGNLIAGQLVAIRPAGTGGAGTGAVLAALQAGSATGTGGVGGATEFVIRKDDGEIAAIALPSPATSPAASLSAAKFSIGDRVELLTGQLPELLHGAP